MKFTRKIPIEYMIITEENLKELALMIVEEAKKVEEGKARLELRYEKGYSETGEDLTLFEKSLDFGKKHLWHAIFSMRDWRNNKGIMVQLHHGFFEESYILIEGEDPDWVNGKVKLFEEIKKSWKKRRFPALPHISKEASIVLYLFICLFLYLEFMLIGLTEAIQNPERPSRDVFFSVSRSFIVALLIFISANFLWPCVELDVRPSRLSFYRKIFFSVLVTVFLGVVSSFIYDLIKIL